MKKTIAVGVSACLLGEKVRYDGDQKRDHNVADILARIFSFVPVCPEVESGMSVPREPMRLEGDPESPRLLTIDSRIDKTEELLLFCRAKIGELERVELCGFIFKMRSPSCGLSGVDVYNGGAPSGKGSGLFAAALTRHFPLLPVEEEGRLSNPEIRADFIEKVLSYHRCNFQTHTHDET